MYLKNIYLRSFRNYSEQKIDFSAQKTILLGKNAQGKSNLLEAVELLSTLKTHRTSSDRDLILTGAKESQIFATLDRIYGTTELALTLRHQGRRSIVLNQETLKRHLDFLGLLNAVQFSSLDLELVRGAPEYRRHWVDGLLVQLEPIYAHILQQYNQVLSQRNALLRAIRQKKEPPTSETQEQLSLWDLQLAERGTRVTRRRSRVLRRLFPLAQKWHSQISGNIEELNINYSPNVPWEKDEPKEIQEAFLAKIEQRRIAEQQLGTSVVGPHRDEIEFKINDTPAKAYGSQGQQRTLVLSLKLAELQLIEQVIKETPILLLDDVLAELDLTRQNHLLEAIQDRFQTLITTTHLNSFDSQWLNNSQILTVDSGKILDF